MTAYHHRCWVVAFTPLLEPGVVAGLDPARRRPVFDWWFAEEQPDVVAVVADLGGTAVGHTVVAGHEVVHVFVDPDHWGNGIGGRLLAEAERTVAAAGFDTAELHTMIGNAPALTLYRGAGWTVADRVVRTDDGDLAFDEHVLVKRLLPDWVQAARDKWTNRGDRRPGFADDPGPGQESVWDYPRPPAVVPDGRRVEVSDADGLIAATTGAIRVLETSHPPAFYLPAEDVVPGRLVSARGSSLCEWKGEAEYVAVAGTTVVVGWRYPAPFPEFATHAGWVSFYPDRVTCRVDGEVASAQAGGFYGGWITHEVVGPFKGAAGSERW